MFEQLINLIPKEIIIVIFTVIFMKLDLIINYFKNLIKKEVKAAQFETQFKELQSHVTKIEKEIIQINKILIKTNQQVGRIWQRVNNG